MARRVVAPAGGLDPAIAAAREVVAHELVKRKRLPRAVAALEASLHPQQRAFVEDASKRVVAHSGRRSGKTWGLGARILRVAERFPGETIPVFQRTQTCESARVLWKTLQDINDSHRLGADFHHSLMICTLPNKAKIVVMGADTMEAADKARGGRYPAAFVDEAGTFRPHILKYLLTEVLTAALLDFDGSLTITGTPTPRKQGAFWQACINPEYSVHHWTFLDNDALPLHQEHLAPAERKASRVQAFEDMLRREGLSADDPRVQREWFGRWVDNDDSVIYRIRPSNYDDSEAPDLSRPGWRFMLGVDVGWEDPTAFVLVAWRRDDPAMWVLESEEHQYLNTDAIVAHAQRFRLRYPRLSVVIDTGSHGGKLCEDAFARAGLRAAAAKKRGKFAHIAFVNSDFDSCRLRLLRATNRALIDDLSTLRRAPPTLDGTVPDKEHPQDDNHLPDALLYAVTHIRGARLGLPEGDPPARGSREWHAARERAWLEADAHATARGPSDLGAEAEAMLPD